MGKYRSLKHHNQLASISGEKKTSTLKDSLQFRSNHMISHNGDSQDGSDQKKHRLSQKSIVSLGAEAAGGNFDLANPNLVKKNNNGQGNSNPIASGGALKVQNEGTINFIKTAKGAASSDWKAVVPSGASEKDTADYTGHDSSVLQVNDATENSPKPNHNKNSI